MKTANNTWRGFGRLLTTGTVMGVVLAIPVLTLIGVVDTSTLVAANPPTNEQTCLFIFQTQTAKCNTLTGLARAACQRQAAEQFRHCRGQASPTAIAAANSTALLSPSPGNLSPEASTSATRSRTPRTKDLDRISRLRARTG